MSIQIRQEKENEKAVNQWFRILKVGTPIFVEGKQHPHKQGGNT